MFRRINGEEWFFFCVKRNKFQGECKNVTNYEAV